MSGSGGVSIARTAIRGENRFYNPPPMRRKQQLQKLREKQRRAEEEEEEEERMLLVEGKNRVVSGSESSGSGRVQSDGSNLDRFLEHTTPFVPVRRIRCELKTCESECNTYFVLEDLWESFAEWSAFGAGVPLHIHGSDSTVQYYVPYLSGIQLYVLDPSNKTRNLVDDNGGSSEGSNHAKTPENAVDLCLGDQSVAGSLSSEEAEISNPHERLLFEYLEYEPPFGREPLANKVSDLASRFPELMTYRSCDLSPSSWVSVSWYPIYGIPVV